MAGTQGFEPRYAAPEAAVLPLDDVPIKRNPILPDAEPRIQHTTHSKLKALMMTWLRVSVLLGLFASAGSAVDWKALKPQGYVSDFARVIDPASKSQLESYCSAVERSTGVNASIRLRVKQGVFLGRPSDIEASADKIAGALTSVSVGGATTFVASGVLNIPDICDA